MQGSPSYEIITLSPPRECSNYQRYGDWIGSTPVCLARRIESAFYPSHWRQMSGLASLISSCLYIQNPLGLVSPHSAR